MSLQSQSYFQFHWGLTTLKQTTFNTPTLMGFQFHWGLTYPQIFTLSLYVFNFQFHWGLTSQEVKQRVKLILSLSIPLRINTVMWMVLNRAGKCKLSIPLRINGAKLVATIMRISYYYIFQFHWGLTLIAWLTAILCSKIFQFHWGLTDYRGRFQLPQDVEAFNSIED